MDGETAQSSALSCMTCRYDLRGLPSEWVCPECGTPIAESIRASEPPDAANPGGTAAWSLLCAILALLTVPALPLSLILAVTGLCLGEQAYRENREERCCPAGRMAGSVGRVLSAAIFVAEMGVIALVAAHSGR